jgi:hypothetical protein
MIPSVRLGREAWHESQNNALNQKQLPSSRWGKIGLSVNVSTKMTVLFRLCDAFKLIDTSVNSLGD